MATVIGGVGLGSRLLDWVWGRVGVYEQTWETLDTLFDGLHGIRKKVPPDEWTHFVSEVCANHPVRHVLHLDPITHRSYEKPRGYAGDAVLLDLIYRECSTEPLVDHSTTLGKLIYSYLVERPGARGLRLRRDLIAQTIDNAADKTPGAHILSVACGHLRELAITRAFPARRLGRVVGLDHDPETIRALQGELAAPGVEPVQGNALHLMNGAYSLGEFDLIYVSGLYDYLNQTMAQRLTQTLFGMLRPGGRLLVMNAVPAFADACYMEAFMAWNLIYRDLEELVELTALLPRTEITMQDVFLEKEQHFAFLDLQRQ